MKNRELFMRAIRALDLEPGTFVLFGSAPMGIRDMRDCQDVDLLVTSAGWDKFNGKPDWELVTFEDGRHVLANQKLNVDLGTTWGPGAWDTEKIIRDAEMIDGLPFARLTEVLRWKKIMNREKDQRDILLIEEYLKKEI